MPQVFDQPSTVPSNQHDKWYYQDYTGAPWLIESYPQAYNRETQVANMPDVNIIPSGTPMLNFAPLQAKDVALCSGLLLDDIIAWCFPIGGANTVGVLVRGHCAINMALLPEKDWLGASYDKVVWAARLETLGFRSFINT